MAQSQQTEPQRRNLVSKLYHWFADGLQRTVWMGVQYTFPKRFVSPLGFLGVLTGITFLVLGVTGGALMIYYQPTLSGCGNITCAFSSVARINDAVPYGWLLRNVHYTASNAMVLLAILHLYYQYFSGRFKIKNEVLWVTGVILGLVTVIEAFTGYDLIFNQRAGLAIEIGSSLANATPFPPGTILRLATFGAGFTDFILRLYSVHVFIFPMVMILLVFIHFPRYMVFDLPVISSVVGGLFIIAGIFPVALGPQYSPSSPTLTVTEWYFNALYALLRTGFDKFVMGGLMPGLLVLMAIVIPFVDTSKKLNWRERPFFTALGITSIGQILVTTAWGFYVNPDTSLPTLSRLIVPPELLFGSLLGITALSFVLTYAFLRYLKSKERVRRAAAPIGPMLTRRWVFVLFFLLIFAQVALNGFAVSAIAQGLRNMALFDVGAVLVSFGIIAHLYRYSQALPF
ncbi:MAG: cytochrome b N-terminal domain-containing protein [Nitrososphaerales archaeon]|nr:cytochrome b N-terminal domain-containing protein [Nitrososphaerales archaeon]